jgi:hypothetical protein
MTTKTNELRNDSYIINVLVHRYDNKMDIDTIILNHCSDVYKKTKSNDFEYVLVIPTRKARTSKAVLYKKKTDQYQIINNINWPGRPDKYYYRTEIHPETEVITNLNLVKMEFQQKGIQFSGPWTVRIVQIDINNL